MSSDARWQTYRAETLRSALVRGAHELGVQVTMLDELRRVLLAGAVATAERRAQIDAIARELLPDYEILNEITIQPMASFPAREELV